MTRRPDGLSDKTLIDRLQGAAFDYFLMRYDARHGLIPDTSRQGSPASIAGMGFALAAYPVGVAHGWITRDEALTRTLKALRFFWHGPPDATFNAIGHRGFCYHYLNVATGHRDWNCELSFIDTVLLVAGMLTVAEFFSGDSAGEREIRDLADRFYRRIEWDWALDGGGTAALSWQPGEGFSPWRWEGYSEGLILYILGMGSPTHPFGPEHYVSWTGQYQWRTVHGLGYLHGGPLFMHQFSHAFIDFRGIRDDFMRDHDLDYFENSRRATLVQQRHAVANPGGFAGYGENCWGLSAGDGPCGAAVMTPNGEIMTMGYAARGVPDSPDDGTLMPSAALASLPFTPQESLAVMRHLQRHYPNVVKHHHIPSAFNPSLTDAAGQVWISDGYYALDQGIVVLMLENYLSGSIWKMIGKSLYVAKGLEKAGFRPA